MKIVNLHHFHVKNVGDIHSSPVHYFDFPYTIAEDDMLDNYAKYINYDAVIFGGGMLLKKLEKLPILDTLAKAKRIGWGIGNSRAKSWFHRYDNSPAIKKFDLLSVRDYRMGNLRYVPCPSCMLPQLDKKYEIKHDIVVYQNTSSKPIDTNLPKMGNDNMNIDEVIEFLASGDFVVSSSYHGVYWAMLLGRKVIGVPFGSKFKNFKHVPPLVEFKKWHKASKNAFVVGGYLEECRKLNKKFHKNVLGLIT